MRERDVEAAWLRLLALQPWAVVLRPRIPRSKRGSAGRRIETEARARMMAEVAAEIRRKPAQLVIWRNNTGVARGASGGLVQYGVPGAADYEGIWSPVGRKVACELKSPTGRQSPEQQAYQAIVEAAGGLYVLVREPAEGVSLLARGLGLR